MYGIVCLKILLLTPLLTLFKNRLDKVWSTQELKYNWELASRNNWNQKHFNFIVNIFKFFVTLLTYYS